MLWAACFAVFGCTTIAGLDKDYSLVEDGSGGSGGSGGSDVSGGSGGSAGSGGSGGSGGSSGSGAPGGSGGDNTGGGAGVDAGGAGGSGGSGAAPATESCDNGADDDGDGKRDCFDSDCDGTTACEGTCVDAAAIACNTTYTGQSSSAQGSTQRIAPPEYQCSPGARAGPEYTYRVQTVVGEDAFVSIFGLSGDLDLFMVEVSEGAQCDAVRSCRAFGGAVVGTDPEALGFTPTSGRDYFVIVDGAAAADYSIAVHCSRRSTCRPVRAIRAGQTISATNAAGSAPNVTRNQTTYTCAGGLHGAPEAAFVFTPTVSGDYDVTLTGMTGNLALFVIGAPDCDTTCLSPTSSSNNAATQDEALVLTATANTSYYIVVDGFVVSPFTLSVTQR